MGCSLAKLDGKPISLPEDSRIPFEGVGLTHDSKAFHQLLPSFHGEFWIQSPEHLFAPFGIHGGEVAHQFVARFPFRITTTGDADGENGGHCPHCYVSSAGHLQN